MLGAALVWGSMVFGPPEPQEPLPSPSQRPSHSIAGGWLQISPLGFGLPGPGSTTDLRVFERAVSANYRWGFSAGVSFEPVEHLFINASAAFDQAIWMFDNDDPSYELCFRGDCYGWTERGLGQLIRIGPELRLGWTSRWFLTWALLSAHVGLGRIRLDCDNSVESHCDRSETDLGPGLGAGFGFAIRPLPRFAVGLESSIDHTWLDRRDDPFQSVRTWDLALVAVVHF